MEQMPRKHMVITGTERAGTSLLMQLLTSLGVDTGFTEEDLSLEKNSRAGLEKVLLLMNEDSPYVVKDTWFFFYPKEILENPDIIIEHVFIPMRDLKAAAESRRHVSKKSLQKLTLIDRMKVRFGRREHWTPGGLWPSHKRQRQESLLLERLYDLLLELSKTEIPVTLMNYPRLVKDSRYLFRKLSPILENIEYDYFSRVFDRIADEKLVHSFSNKDK